MPDDFTCMIVNCEKSRRERVKYHWTLKFKSLYIDYLLHLFWFSATQMLCLALHLPFIIGHAIHEDDDRWRCFILLLKITSICSTYEIKKEHIPVLKMLIDEHHSLFRVVYPDASFIPKMHYMVHYPSLLLRYYKLQTLYKKLYFFKNLVSVCAHNPDCW